MKSFSEIKRATVSEAAAAQVELKQKSIDADTLKKFAAAGGKMLSEDAARVIKDNNGDEFSPAKYTKEISALASAGRVRELPWYLTKEETDDVVNGRRPLDFYVYDLTSERGRNELVRKFEPMLRRISYSYANANGISADDTYSAGLEGFTRALNNYGKSRSEYVRTKSEEEHVDLDKIAASEGAPRNIPFASYATAMVSNFILVYIKDEMSLVRRPQSDQAKERAATGNISKEKKVSGDAYAGTDKDGDARNMWDKLASDISADKIKTPDEEVKALWKTVYDAVEAKFGKEIAELWYKKNGINGRKLDKSTSTPTEYYKLRNISKFLLTDKACRAALDEIREIMAEENE